MALEDVLEFRFGKGVIGWSKVCVCVLFFFNPAPSKKHAAKQIPRMHLEIQERK